MHQYAITGLYNAPGLGSGFGQAPGGALRMQATVQAEANNLDTAMANFRLGVQTFQHPMQKPLLGLIDLAIATARNAQIYFTTANTTGWNRELERSVESVLGKARQHYAAASVMSTSVGGPKAQGVWTPTAQPVAAGGEALLAEGPLRAGVTPWVWIASAVVASVWLIGWRGRRKRR